MEDRFIVGTKLYVAAFFQRDARCNGGAENASTGKRKYGKGKYETAHFARMENACMENASTMQTFSQIKKSLVPHKLVWCILQVGGKVDYRLFFCEIT